MVFSSPCRSWYEELKPRLADAMLTTLVGETKTAKGTNFEAVREHYCRVLNKGGEERDFGHTIESLDHISSEIKYMHLYLDF